MFGATGTGLAAIKSWQNEGKPPRYSVDQWDRVCLSISIDAFIWLTILAAKYENLKDAAHMNKLELTGLISDGARSTAHWNSTRADKQRRGAARIRSQQPVERTLFPVEPSRIQRS